MGNFSSPNEDEDRFTAAKKLPVAYQQNTCPLGGLSDLPVFCQAVLEKYVYRNT